MRYDVIIIGAGAAGLMAAYELVQAGHKVCLLEAAARPGGRIETIQQAGFSVPVEAGAEFIHGKMPVTLDLLNKAGIPYVPVRGDFMTIQNGIWIDEEGPDEHFAVLVQKMHELREDCTIQQFLDKYFPAKEYDELRKSVQGFAEGFDLADMNKASVFSVRKEWGHQEEEQYRLPGGYGQLMNYLLESCDKAGMDFHFSSPVHKVEHQPGKAVAHTGGKQYEATKVIITVSAGVLQSGYIQFSPSLKNIEPAIRQLGFGSVLKILIQFKEPFWKKHAGNIGFMITDEAIPTWWTQLPDEIPLLTGWAGGPRAAILNALPGDELYELALTSLAHIFGQHIQFIRDQLVHHKISCWDMNPYIKGGYSYSTLDSNKAVTLLQQPVDNTIYFAGEAIYAGKHQGTVEAALVSGRRVAEMIG